MVRLTVWTFPSPYDAETVVSRLRALAASELIRLDDAALVTWPRGRQAPLLRPLAELPRCWKLDDACWGFLAGALFRRNLLDPTAATDARELGHSPASLGLSPAMLDSIGALVVEGTSALVLLIETEVVRRIRTAFEGMGYTLVEAPLTLDQQQSLRSLFGAHKE